MEDACALCMLRPDITKI